MKTETKFKKGDVVKVPKEYLLIHYGDDRDEFKMVRKVYKDRGIKTLELQGHIFTQDIPASEVELWIKG